jgi:hypothetical protein
MCDFRVEIYSNIRDLLQILATEIQTNFKFNNSPQQNVPKLWKAKKTCPQNRLKKYKVFVKVSM